MPDPERFRTDDRHFRSQWEPRLNPDLNSGALFGLNGEGMAQWRAMQGTKSNSGATGTLTELSLSNGTANAASSGETIESPSDSGSRPIAHDLLCRVLSVPPIRFSGVAQDLSRRFACPE